MKLVLALQFYIGDRDRAMRLARLIADIELAPRTDVEFLFVARYDCDHDRETIDYVAKKFPVHWITTCTKWRGWPGGPNAMAKDLLEWTAANRKDVDGLLMIEPDCVPTSPFWLNHIGDAWNDALADGKWIMGAWRQSGGVHGHINGNCVVRPDFSKLVGTADVVGPELAWDCAISPYVKDHWKITGTIKNCFEARNATIEHLFDPVGGEELPALVHGFKDDSAYDLARSVVIGND